MFENPPEENVAEVSVIPVVALVTRLAVRRVRTLFSEAPPYPTEVMNGHPLGNVGTKFVH